MANDQSKSRKGGRKRSLLLTIFFWLALFPLVLAYAIGWILVLTAPQYARLSEMSQAVQVAPEDIRLTFDLSGTTPAGKRITHQTGFDALLQLVNDADELLVLDEFLVNQYRGRGQNPAHRDVTGELINAILTKKKQSPNCFILFITDPVNSAYAEQCPETFRPLREAGVHVLVTDLSLLPDRNWVWSPFYRVIAPFYRWLDILKRDDLDNVFDASAPRMSWMEGMRLLNFKANHRKVTVMRDRTGSYRALVTSANPHTASSAHCNVGVLLLNGPLTDLLANELSLARNILLYAPQNCYSRVRPEQLLRDLEKRLKELRRTPGSSGAPGAPRVRFCTEEAIARKVQDMLARSGTGDQVDIQMFYLSDPMVIGEIKNAARRGSRIRILLDPNTESFGRERSGVPNQATAAALHRWADRTGGDIQLRWFATRGWQGHGKCMRVNNPTYGRDELLIGSANFTVRNLGGYNLETAIVIENAGEAGARYGQAFLELWENQGGVIYSADYEKYAIRNKGEYYWKSLVTTLSNVTGFCTY